MQGDSVHFEGGTTESIRIYRVNALQYCTEQYIQHTFTHSIHILDDSSDVADAWAHRAALLGLHT